MNAYASYVPTGYGRTRTGVLAACLLTALPAICGCLPDSSIEPSASNITDPTNNGATYIGAAACLACHSGIVDQHRLHAHSHALTAILGQAPTFPDDATRADVPNPPTGSAWTDIAYLISGYLHGANFIDQDGFVMTDGVEGVNTLWQLTFPPNGTTASFTAFLPSQADPKPYEYSCFKCHTTNPAELASVSGPFQDGRSGIKGTWDEAGVQCEACHGGGSRHATAPDEGTIYVGSTASLCGRCHTDGDDEKIITARDGFVKGQTQWPQLLASGGHADFACVTCHDPHTSITYADRGSALRNTCTTCHEDVNMAFHDNVTYTRGDYQEQMTCESCHMPFAGISVSTASPAVVGSDARMADVRTHIFRIDTEHVDYTSMFTTDGSQVVTDDQGRAAVTADFVCLRCHNNTGNAFGIQLDVAYKIAADLHIKAASE